jgi:hypothetical protein
MERRFGRRSSEVAAILDLLGEVTFMMQSYDLSEGLLMRSLKISISLYGHEHVDSVRAQTNLAVVLKAKDTALREKDRLTRSQAAVVVATADIVHGTTTIEG